MPNELNSSRTSRSVDQFSRPWKSPWNRPPTSRRRSTTRACPPRRTTASAAASPDNPPPAIVTVESIISAPPFDVRGAGARGSADPRKPSRRRLRIDVPCVADLSCDLPLLAVGQPDVYRHKHWKHREGEKRRPLQKKPNHDDDERSVLRMPDAGVRASRGQCPGLLGFVEHSPCGRQ